MINRLIYEHMENVCQNVHTLVGLLLKRPKSSLSPPKPNLNVDSGWILLFVSPDWHSRRARLIQEAVGYINTVMAFDIETGTRNQICMRHAMTICVIA